MTDDNANLPVANRPETVLGTTITFLLVALIAVTLRLYVRYKERLWGWDDFFVFMAGLSTTAGSTITCVMPTTGMGKHFWTLDDAHITEYFKHIWSSNVTYTASTTFIKLAILLQYLRLFDMQSAVARRLSKSMIVLVALWGITFFCLALFACMPIAKNWNFTLPGKCVAWGSKDGDTLFASFAAHSASNMLLDILVLVLPIPFLKSLRMKGRTRMGIVGLFVMGGIVAVLSVARMFALSLKRAGTVPVFDPTFAAPAVYIFSILEINIAILCASIPIFWPFVSSLAANKILVVNEIEVRTDIRDSHGIGLAEQGSSYGGVPEPEVTGRTSRMSVIMSTKVDKISRSNSKHHKQKPSNSSSHNTAPIELGRRISQDSSRNLAHHQSNGSLSTSTSPDQGGILRNGSVGSTGKGHYQDRYVQDWVCPDFDKQTGGNTYTTTVERAEVPFDHIRALEK